VIVGKRVMPGVWLVEVDRIVALSPEATPAGARVVDLPWPIRLPYLIDAHTHLGSGPWPVGRNAP